MKKIIYIDPSVKNPDTFKKVLEGYGERFEVISEVPIVSVEKVDIAIIWREVPDILKNFINLQVILVCGSGIDHLIGFLPISKSVIMIRLVDPYLRSRVANYVLKYALMYCQHLQKSIADSRKKVSDDNHCSAKSEDLVIGILGLGLVGNAVAEILMNNGFKVIGWVRTQKDRPIKNVYVGQSELGRFAASCNILICQLPLTNETRGILNIDLFNKQPKGSYLINVGRGGHLNEADLITALNSGQLSGACLDVFNIEPLPSDHPFNSHPKIITTPHIAGAIHPENLAHYAMIVLKDFFSNKHVDGIVDYASNY